MNEEELKKKLIRPGFGDSRVTVDVSGPVCQHYYVTVFEKRGVVYCRNCKQAVNPIEVLLSLSREWSWATHWQRELEQRAARVTELKAEEANIKARLRAAYRKVPEPRSKLFYEELLRRLNAVKNYEDLNQVSLWARKLPWFDREEQEVLAAAERRAQERAKKASSKRRPRHVRVVKS